ncbi:MAG: hypothetical protein AAF236_09900 [Verrucomicrobiota bacterium]
MPGYLKLHRRILDWEHYSDANVLRVFVDFLLRAQYQETTFQGVFLCPGQFIAKATTIEHDLNLSRQQLRTIVAKLKSTGELTVETTNRKTIYTLVNWGLYQDPQPAEQPKAQPHNQPAEQPNQQPQANHSPTSLQPQGQPPIVQEGRIEKESVSERAGEAFDPEQPFAGDTPFGLSIDQIAAMAERFSPPMPRDVVETWWLSRAGKSWLDRSGLRHLNGNTWRPDLLGFWRSYQSNHAGRQSGGFGQTLQLDRSGGANATDTDELWDEIDEPDRRSA